MTSELYTTNLGLAPYYSNFDQAKQQYRYLFKASIPLQVQELQGIQAMLQDQISKFGRNVYKEGSIVEGCRFSFDVNNLYYIKINDNYTNGSAIATASLAALANNRVYNANGLYAQIITSISGSTTAAPNTNTLYIKYQNAANTQSEFAANDVLTVTNSISNATICTIQVCTNTVIANIGAPSGKSYALGVSEGVIFHKGTFVYVLPQYVIVSLYSGYPNNLSVGFSSVETIVTADMDETLYDNADGSPNYAAPGADRLQIVPYLNVINTNAITNTSTFFSLVDFVDGAAATIRQREELSSLGDYIATRVYEAHGDFVVRPFKLSTIPLDSSNSISNTYVALQTDAGIGYVEGYRVEHTAPIPTLLRKANDFANVTAQQVTANFGYYAFVKELAGTFLSGTGAVQVELHNVAKTAVSGGSLLGVGYSTATKIGTAYVRGITLDTIANYLPSTTYKVYLFNIQMSPGFNFGDVKSIINYSGSVLGVSDVVLTYNASTGTNTAVLQDTYLNGMVYNFGATALKPDGFGNTAAFNYKAKVSTTVQTNGYASVSVGAAAGTGVAGFAYTGTMSGDTEKKFIIVPTANGIASNSSANVVIVAGANTVIANGSTSFLTDYAIGDYVAVYTTATPEIKLITNIANNTYMNVASNFATSNGTTRHATAFPAGIPINFSGKATRTITTTSNTTGGFQLEKTMQGTFGADVYFDIKRSSTVPTSKVVKKLTYVKIDCSNNAANSTGPWCLGLPDVLNVSRVFLGSGGTYSNSGTDYSANFFLDNGQRDCHYGLAYLYPKTNIVPANGTILVELTHFTHNASQGVGFFTANSYPIDANTANTNAIQISDIPLYTTQKGTVFDLRDCVDFRVRASNTAVSSNTVAGATINPSSTVSFSSSSYLVAPDSNFQSDLQYYMPRVDRAVIDINGTLSIVEGNPQVINPQPPEEPAMTMTLGIISVPPYPSLSTPEAKAEGRYDYAIQCKLQQNRRYTMRDIGVLDSRITNIEYYTSLNLLEQSAQSLLVRSSTTGQNRFRNGIFVDPFNGFDISNTNDPNFKIAIDSDRSEIRPRFAQRRTDMSFDANNSTNTVLHGELVMLQHSSNNLYITQPYASKYRNCIEGNVFEWLGTMTLNPPATLDPDLSTSPDVINNLDLAANWINLGQSAWGTHWGNWVDVATNVTVNTASSTSGSTTTTTTQTTTTTTQQKTGQQLNVTTQQNQYNLGTFVTNISLLPYLKPAVIRFTAHGLKPNTRVYAFFNNVAVSNYCAPRFSDFTFNSISGDKHSGFYGDPLWTDSTGSIYGTFVIPANTFRSQELIFMLTDVSDIVAGALAMKTKATATFYGSRLAFSTASSILNTREAVVNLNEITESKVITGTNVTTSIVTTPTIPYTPYTPYNPAGGGGGGEGPGTSADSDGDGCACGDGAE